MSLATNLRGRLRNTVLPKTHALLPVFEAVVNSIHAIEESGKSSKNGKITVEIIRLSSKGQRHLFDEEKKPGPEAEDEITGFAIVDNGIGFTDINMESFETLDTDHKIDRGCRGVGRLLWLKAFDKIEVDSQFLDNAGLCKKRTFILDAEVGIADHKVEIAPKGAIPQTTVQLTGFGNQYKEYARKTAPAIARLLLEHCLWYFIREGGAPKIHVVDPENNLDLDDVYDEQMMSSAKAKQLIIKGQTFEITHLKLRGNVAQNHAIFFCAGSRVVREDNITGKLPGLYGKLKEGESEFIYSCYVGSSYLDDHVRAERTGFDFDEIKDSLFSETEISATDIKKGVLESAKTFLGESLIFNQEAGKARLASYVASIAPKYRPIIGRLSDDEKCIDPDISDKELDLALHKKLHELETTLIEEGHELMTPSGADAPEVYRTKIADYLEKASELKKSDLASYVSHRRVIIDLFRNAIQRDNDGNYAREDLIHQMIMPMGKTSNDLLPESANLWLIDERLAFHDYLASDKGLRSMPITGSESGKEPDILALNVFDNPILVSEESNVPLASIVVIEIKRPMRNDAKEGEEKDPIEQALGYLERVREGQVVTSTGRPIPSSNSIPGFCYILCDLTPSMHKRCKMHDAILTSDGMGYFYYNKNYQSYVEVISFDRLVNMATERNRAFFDKLGLPSK
jgi:hypothetical protein